MKLVVTVTLLLSFLTFPVAAATDAAALFKAKCAACHGEDGTGNTAMGRKLNIRSLASPDVQKQTDAQILEITKKGKGKMPSYDGKISEGDLKALVAHIRKFKAK
ncbi:MAG TPA: cytochrome c [Thermoanaerobaculia bacterium]|nr:cytochrome c [Thermoanaerobaculia bacterium]